MHRPDTLKLLKGHMPQVGRRRPETPGQFPVACPESVDTAIHAAEDDTPREPRRRRIDARSGDEMPRFLPCHGIECVQRVSLDRGNEDLAPRNDGRAEATAEFCLPRRGDVRGEILVREAAALCVVAVGGPVLRVGVGGER